ncbi:16367_t:CDS:2 [Acaulospora morrowiae]|uniref:16367_t:CDS:1 n=1 Tax=Acaulospora morrowiae TaxID=94023 RepID=A0A9N8YP45_9GLOM|nr:16367_t:CDS:2 [Acaulospora morrowiae]
MTKHPSSVKLNAVKKDETSTSSITSLQQTAAEKEAIKTERVRTEAKLEGRNPDSFIKVYNERESKSTGSGLVINARNKENRSSREFGKGSSSPDEKYADEYMELCFPDSPSVSQNSISPRESQLLDDLDDTVIKITSDKDKKYLGMIAEEEEINSSRFNSSSNSGYIINDLAKFQNRVNDLKNSDLDSTSYASSTADTEISIFNDTESSTSGGTNEPESPLSLPIPNSKGLQKRKNSFGFNSGRNNLGGRSIFSVLSTTSLHQSTSISPKNSTRGSLSEPEGEFPREFSPSSPSKADKILGRTKLSSLSLRKNRSKSAISDDRSLLSFYMGYDPGLSSPESGEKPSKVGKILGLTAVEEKILLDKPPTGKNKKSRGTSETRVSSNKNFKIPVSPSSPDERSKAIRASKAGKILGWDDANSKLPIGGPITVSSISNSNNLVLKGYMSKYQNTKFLSKSWKKRYFILTKNTLYCFKSNESSTPQIDNFELTSETAVYLSDDFNARGYVLGVNKGGKPWHLQVDNVEEMKKWMGELKRVIKNCSEDPKGSLVGSVGRIIEDHSLKSTKTAKRTSPIHSITEPPDSIDDIVDQISLPPPPRPSMITSLPPPPRPRSAPNSSCPPSPTAVASSSSQLMSPHSYGFNEFSGVIEFESPLRPSSPVETLSPPRTRYGQNMLTKQNERSVHVPQHNRNQSSAFGPINVTMQSRQSSSSSLNSQRSSKQAPSTIRQSIPIIMPSWIMSSSSMPNSSLSSSPASTSLTPPPRSPPRPPPRVHPSVTRPIQRTVSNPPVTSLTSDIRLSKIGPPPSIPLPLPPPRPLCTIAPHNRPQPIPPPRTSRSSKDLSNGKTGNAQNTQRVSLAQNSKTALRSKSPPPRFSSVAYSPAISLPPPSRPPNLPLPPVPETPPVKNDGFIIAKPKSRTTLSPSKETIEFPDDDDLDPDYAEEVEASRRRSQKTEGSISSSDTTFFSISDISHDEVPQLSASGLTFVMIEETLGDGELVLDLQYVKNDKDGNRFINSNFEDSENINSSESMTNSEYSTIMSVDTSLDVN